MTEITTVAVLAAGGTMGLAIVRNLTGAGIGVRAHRSARHQAGRCTGSGNQGAGAEGRASGPGLRPVPGRGSSSPPTSWLVAAGEGAAERFALTEGLGLDPALLFEAVRGGCSTLLCLQLNGKAMTERSFEEAVAEHSEKDLSATDLTSAPANVAA